MPEQTWTRNGVYDHTPNTRGPSNNVATAGRDGHVSDTYVSDTRLHAMHANVIHANATRRFGIVVLALALQSVSGCVSVHAPSFMEPAARREWPATLDDA